MKYIRTKDRIYEIESDYLNNKGVRVGYNVVGQEEVVLIENNSIKQADTIEELCDEFVFDSNISSYVIDKKHIEHVKATILKIYKENDETDYVKAMHPKFYGAVWCEFGLKYVAKLNDKGDLELICID